MFRDTDAVLKRILAMCTNTYETNTSDITIDNRKLLDQDANILMFLFLMDD